MDLDLLKKGDPKAFEELRKRIVSGDREAVEIFRQLASDPAWARAWLSQFGVSVSGSGDFADWFAKALALYNATALLPVQGVRIDVVTGRVPDPYGAYVEPLGGGAYKVVYDPSKNKFGTDVLIAHEAAHVVQDVVNWLYKAGGSYTPANWESMAEALARWITGLYKYNPETGREVAKQLLERGLPDKPEHSYSYYVIWPLTEPGDYRDVIKQGLNTAGFLKMLEKIAADGSVASTTSTVSTTQSTTQSTNVTATTTPVQNVTSKNNTSNSTSPITVVGEFTPDIPMPQGTPTGTKHPLPELIRRYATESGKVVFYAEGWDFLDFKIGRDVKRSIAWLADIKGGNAKVKYSCIEYEDGWKCQDVSELQVPGIPTSVNYDLQIIHKGNVVGTVKTYQLDKLSEPLDLKHGQGTPWNRLTAMTTNVATGTNVTATTTPVQNTASPAVMMQGTGGMTIPFANAPTSDKPVYVPPEIQEILKKTPPPSYKPSSDIGDVVRDWAKYEGGYVVFTPDQKELWIVPKGALGNIPIKHCKFEGGQWLCMGQEGQLPEPKGEVVVVRGGKAAKATITSLSDLDKITPTEPWTPPPLPTAGPPTPSWVPEWLKPYLKPWTIIVKKGDEYYLYEKKNKNMDLGDSYTPLHKCAGGKCDEYRSLEPIEGVERVLVVTENSTGDLELTQKKFNIKTPLLGSGFKQTTSVHTPLFSPSGGVLYRSEEIEPSNSQTEANRQKSPFDVVGDWARGAASTIAGALANFGAWIGNVVNKIVPAAKAASTEDMPASGPAFSTTPPWEETQIKTTRGGKLRYEASQTSSGYRPVDRVYEEKQSRTSTQTARSDSSSTSTQTSSGYRPADRVDEQTSTASGSNYTTRDQEERELKRLVREARREAEKKTGGEKTGNVDYVPTASANSKRPGRQAAVPI